MALPLPGSGRCVTEVEEAGRRIAAIVHDDALLDQGDLVEAAVSCARIALENQRLAAEVESSLRDVRESRARILASADEERRRIERDLHDGAQQRLVALRIKLELHRGASEGRSDSRSREAAQPRRGRGRHDRRDSLPRRRGLPSAARRPGVVGSAARRGIALAGGGHRGGQRHRTLLAGHRNRRLLLLPGGAAKRGQARTGRHEDRHIPRRPRPPLRFECPTTDPASPPGRHTRGRASPTWTTVWQPWAESCRSPAATAASLYPRLGAALARRRDRPARGDARSPGHSVSWRVAPSAANRSRLACRIRHLIRNWSSTSPAPPSPASWGERWRNRLRPGRLLAGPGRALRTSSSSCSTTWATGSSAASADW